MAFFPMEFLKYKIDISKEEMIDRLNANIEPQTFFNWSSYGKSYFGEIYENGFKMIRHSVGKNSFRPIIIGNIVENDTGNIVEILMRPYVIVLIFMSIVVGMLGIIAPIITFATSFDIDEVFVSLIAIFIFWFFLFIGALFFYSIMVLFFKLESKQAKKYVSALLDGEIIEEEDNVIRILKYAAMKKAASNIDDITHREINNGKR
jgi:glucan phosphoethanolaminetransferase (alkaline phosphatase superfamily)